ncbi:MAG: hypothetical protein ABEK59_04225 [Halobacteria archaeon]
MAHRFQTFRNRVENADLKVLEEYFGEFRKEAKSGSRDEHHYLGITIDSKGSIAHTNIYTTDSMLKHPPGDHDVIVELQTATAENYSKKEVLELIRSKVMDATMSLITRLNKNDNRY